MKNRIRLVVVGFIFCANSLFSQTDFDFKELLPEKFDKANIIQEEDYNVWGTNILKGKDGKYHEFIHAGLKVEGIMVG